MKLFSNNGSVLSPVDGVAIALDAVGDEAFASGMLGIGFGVIPTSGDILCPIDGRVTNIAEAHHAYGIEGEGGIELLVHIGIDTVGLGGVPFKPLVRHGDTVRAGDRLASADLALIREGGCEATVVTLITNPELTDRVKYYLGEVRGGKTRVMNFRILSPHRTAILEEKHGTNA